jgi:hypothetical protein
MNRTAALKLGYVIVLAVLGLAAFLLVDRFGIRAALPLIVLLLIPGRIQGVILRDLFTGRRRIDDGEPGRAIEALERMQATLEAAPWKRRTLWLAWSVYTVDALAMTLHNLGAAHQQAGDHGAARARFEHALRIDPRYPLPHAGLALLAAFEGDGVTAERHKAQAIALGFAATRLDEFLRAAQSTLARVEGNGRDSRG